MGQIVVEVLKYLVKEARLPRAVWFLFAGGITFILVAIGVRILGAKEIAVDAADRYHLSIVAQRQVEHREARLEATLKTAMDRLSALEKKARKPEAKRVFSAAQMDLRALEKRTKNGFRPRKIK
jgi:hypothetical protein